MATLSRIGSTERIFVPSGDSTPRTVQLSEALKTLVEELNSPRHSADSARLKRRGSFKIAEPSVQATLNNKGAKLLATIGFSRSSNKARDYPSLPTEMKPAEAKAEQREIDGKMVRRLSLHRMGEEERQAQNNIAESLIQLDDKIKEVAHGRRLEAINLILDGLESYLEKKGDVLHGITSFYPISTYLLRLKTKLKNEPELNDCVGRIEAIKLKTLEFSFRQHEKILKILNREINLEQDPNNGVDPEYFNLFALLNIEEQKPFNNITQSRLSLQQFLYCYRAIMDSETLLKTISLCLNNQHVNIHRKTVLLNLVTAWINHPFNWNELVSNSVMREKFELILNKCKTIQEEYATFPLVDPAVKEKFKQAKLLSEADNLNQSSEQSSDTKKDEEESEVYYDRPKTLKMLFLPNSKPIPSINFSV